MSTGPYERKGDKWCPTIVAPDGVTVIELGEFATRAEARVAYMQKHRELYPQEPPRTVDPARSNSLEAANLVGKSFKTYH